jgi:hypothetical protein
VLTKDSFSNESKNSFQESFENLHFLLIKEENFRLKVKLIELACEETDAGRES